MLLKFTQSRETLRRPINTASEQSPVNRDSPRYTSTSFLGVEEAPSSNLGGPTNFFSHLALGFKAWGSIKRFQLCGFRARFGQT